MPKRFKVGSYYRDTASGLTGAVGRCIRITSEGLAVVRLPAWTADAIDVDIAGDSWRLVPATRAEITEANKIARERRKGW